jgi:transcription elongation factor Elf1
MKKKKAKPAVTDPRVEEMGKRLVQATLMPKECEAPKGTSCSKCGSEDVIVMRALFSHWSGGEIVCKKCGYKQPVIDYLSKSMIVVEPIE